MHSEGMTKPQMQIQRLVVIFTLRNLQSDQYRFHGLQHAGHAKTDRGKPGVVTGEILTSDYFTKLTPDTLEHDETQLCCPFVCLVPLCREIPFRCFLRIHSCRYCVAEEQAKCYRSTDQTEPNDLKRPHHVHIGLNHCQWS